MMFKTGLVSCIIPTYRRSDTLGRAIQSVVDQTYKNIEVLVVDDNMKGDEYSARVIETVGKFSDQRVHYVTQVQHINGAEARNAGIRASKGEYIAFLDDDDWWDKEKIEKQVEFIKQCPPTCGVVSTLLRYYANGKLIKQTLPYKGGYIYKEILRREYSVMTSSVLIKKNALDEAGYFDVALKRAQDLQLLANLTYKFELYQLPEYLVNINVDDSGNRGDSRRTIEIKKAFFRSVGPILESLTPREKKQIYSLHQFERFPAELREGRYLSAIVDCLQICRDPLIVYYAFKKVIRKKKEINQAKKVVNKNQTYEGC